MDLPFNTTLVLVFVGVTGMVLAAARLISASDARVDARIRGASGSPAMDRALLRPQTRSRSPLWTFVSQLTAYLLPRKAEERGQLHPELVQAGYESPAASMTFLLVQVAVAIALATTGDWLGRGFGLKPADTLIATIIAGCGGYLLPGLWLRRRKAARQGVLRRSLPDFLDLTVTCLQAGMIFDAAIQRVSKELEPAHPLLARELGRVRQEIELGSTADRGLLAMADRTGMDAIRSLAMVCQQSRRLGTKLASTLRTHADTLRDRRENDAEESAQKAAVKILIPTLLCLFPCIFVILAGPAAIQVADQFGDKSQVAPETSNVKQKSS